MRQLGRKVLLVLLLVLAVGASLWLSSGTASATPVDPPEQPAPGEPAPAPGDDDGGDAGQDGEGGEGGGGLSVDINGPDGTPSSAVVTLIAITLLSVAPALLLMMSSFTKIFVVLALTRNALSLPSIPPNQVLAGLALFLSLFIMSPVLSEINELAVQPYTDGGLTFTEALEAGSEPLRQFMLAHTREEDIALMTRAADLENPGSPEDVALTTLIPSFMISELRAAFIIGFVIFVPFLVIDLVVASALMSMGMMMLPPVMISLPFKILLFILVDGWGLIITALVGSYSGGG
ncbi:flagellar type III secretion system pore protein FliP [Nesterenkonia sp. Act20]|uniref:flagellar type III secretion system pore protein FliP n=1 Tax=Nesterenkonia sp. Act20 TaxID=1483432 RepID=UPI001C496A70|nr:flagellar type III secretion system pore protein FliP [Nesterenkonia sp. Act20]